MLGWVSGALGARARPMGDSPHWRSCHWGQAFAQGTDLCALSALCVRKMSHAESAEIAEALGLGGVPIEGR